jgi:hypothetical protein
MSALRLAALVAFAAALASVPFLHVGALGGHRHPDGAVADTIPHH